MEVNQQDEFASQTEKPFLEKDGWFVSVHVPDKSQGRWGFATITPEVANRYFKERLNESRENPHLEKFNNDLKQGKSVEVFIHQSLMQRFGIDAKLHNGMRIVPGYFDTFRKYSEGDKPSLDWCDLWFEDTIKPLSPDLKVSLNDLLLDESILKHKIPDDEKIKVGVPKNMLDYFAYRKPDIKLDVWEIRKGGKIYSFKEEVGKIDLKSGTLFGFPVKFEGSELKLVSSYSQDRHSKLIELMFGVNLYLSGDGKKEGFSWLMPLLDEPNASRFAIHNISGDYIPAVLNLLERANVRFEVANNTVKNSWYSDGEDSLNGVSEGGTYNDLEIIFPDGLKDSFNQLEKSVLDLKNLTEKNNRVIQITSKIRG